jgi:hypothetical protein
MSDKLVPYAIRGIKNRVLHLGEEEEVVGWVSDKEFKLLFGFTPAVDIKLTPQQDEKLTAYIKRRDGRSWA